LIRPAVIEVAATAVSTASPDRIFHLLEDHATWPQWSGFFIRTRLLRKGVHGRLGVGAVRVMTTPISRVREEVIDAEPGVRFSYRLLAGLPLRDYRADVELSALDEGGTRIEWRAAFRPRWWGTGWFWRRVMQRALDRLEARLAAA
jgi:hypothetical protein